MSASPPLFSLLGFESVVFSLTSFVTRMRYELGKKNDIVYQLIDC
jgi:hypothetical protein